MEYEVRFIERFRYYVDRSEYTHNVLSEKMGITPVSFSRYYNGSRIPKITLVPNMCKAFNITPNDFFGWR